MELHNEAWLESAQGDFETFLQKKEWKNARAVIDSVGENGFENEALAMHYNFNRHYSVLESQLDVINSGIRL